MTIREYLESKPDNFRFEILYQFDNWCPECRKHSTTIDDEYSADGTAGDFRQQVEGTCSGFNHYRNYDFVYEDFSIDDITVELEESDDGATITITMTGNARVCEDCEEKRLEEYAEAAEDPEEITGGKYADLANIMTESIKELAADPERLENFNSYLSHHFPDWIDKYAGTPVGLAHEFAKFAGSEED